MFSYIHLYLPARQQHKDRKINANIHTTADIGGI